MEPVDAVKLERWLQALRMGGGDDDVRVTSRSDDIDACDGDDEAGEDLVNDIRLNVEP